MRNETNRRSAEVMECPQLYSHEGGDKSAQEKNNKGGGGVQNNPQV